MRKKINFTINKKYRGLNNYPQDEIAVKSSGAGTLLLG